jgi:WD40 repeat protein
VVKLNAGPAHVVAFSPDGTRIAVGGGISAHPGEISVWEVVSGKNIKRVANPPGPVTGLTFDRDGNHLLSVGGDGIVRIWNSATGESLRGYKEPTASLCRLPFLQTESELLPGDEINRHMFGTSIREGCSTFCQDTSLRSGRSHSVVMEAVLQLRVETESLSCGRRTLMAAGALPSDRMTK